MMINLETIPFNEVPVGGVFIAKNGLGEVYVGIKTSRGYEGWNSKELPNGIKWYLTDWWQVAYTGIILQG